MMKLDIEFIKCRFNKEGYILLSTIYINNRQKLKYVCPKSHKHSISWSDWSHKGARCPYCYGNNKHALGSIRNDFRSKGYTLITSEYINSSQKLEYICPKGHKHSMSWRNWKQGHRCPHCAGQAKPTIEFVGQSFSSCGYKLLTKDYVDSHQKLKYTCPVGHIHSIRWNDWQQNHRCPTCWALNKFGSGNPNWKGGISCEPYCQIWSDKEYKESIKQRDGYRCINPDCWNTHKALSIHHIDYNKKSCVPENLITLCRSCNGRANKDRDWHKAWYQTIIYRRYRYQYKGRGAKL